MILSELKTAIADWTHRTDLEPHMGTFVNSVSSRLGRRFGVMPALLIADDDITKTTSGSLTLNAGGSVYAHGTLITTAGGDIEISAGGTVYLYANLNASGDILIIANVALQFNSIILINSRHCIKRL